MPKSIFFPGREEGFETKSVTDTRATTDKNDPFLNMGLKHGKQWVEKNGAKCNMGFGRITKNTREAYQGSWDSRLRMPATLAASGIRSCKGQKNSRTPAKR